MLLELGGVLLSALVAVDNNDTQRSSIEAEREAEEIRYNNDLQQRKHETTMAIVNGVFGLLQAAMVNTDNRTTSVAVKDNELEEIE